MNKKLLHTVLFAWFRKHGRILPWRMRELSALHKAKKISKTKVSVLRDSTIASYFTTKWNRDPYTIIVSELMLQQTQVDRVLPKFESFIRKWPTVHDLSKAKLSEVLIEWKGLGYNRRAKFLHEMAHAVVHTHKGNFPKTEEELRKLSGVGEYTARAVLTFAYGKDIGVVDTNIRRIFSSVMFGKEAGQVDISTKEFFAVIDQSVPRGKGDPWNQALMDFGALVCTAKAPKCDVCPLQTVCIANLSEQKHGFRNYADSLATKNKKINIKKSGAKKIPFKQADRYFRGKVIDILRDGPHHMEKLHQQVKHNYKLHDKKRWGNIIESLMIDGLITIRGSTVSLA